MRKRIHRITADLALLGLLSCSVLVLAFVTSWKNFSRLESSQRIFVNQIGDTGKIIVELDTMKSTLTDYRRDWSEENYRLYRESSLRLDSAISACVSDGGQTEDSLNILRRLSWFNDYQRGLIGQEKSDAKTLFDTTSYILQAIDGHARIMAQTFQDLLARNSADYFERQSLTLRRTQMQFQFLVAAIVLIIVLFIRLVLWIDMSLKASRKNLERLALHDWSVPDLEGAHFQEFRRLFSAINHVKKELHGYFMRQQKEAAMEKELVNAKLQALRAQVNPHFLFNTLHQIGMASLVEGPETVMQLVEATGKILRYSLDRQERVVPLEDELEVVRQYLFIQKKCHDRPIEGEITGLDNLPASCRILPMSIQPLVENAVKHGYDGSRKGPFLVSISCFLSGGDLVVSVRDNGVGFGEEKAALREGGGGIGLSNIRARLAMVYGRDDLLVVKSEKGKYTEVAVTFPQAV